MSTLFVLIIWFAPVILLGTYLTYKYIRGDDVPDWMEIFCMEDWEDAQFGLCIILILSWLALLIAGMIGGFARIGKYLERKREDNLHNRRYD